MKKYNEILLSPAEAFDLYIDKYPDTIVIEVELELKSGSYVYKVKGFDEEKEYKIYINPYNKQITEVSEKISKGMFTEIVRDNTDSIQELVDDAINDAGNNSILEEWSLEIDDGILELEVEIIMDNGEDIKYEYNLTTKELIKKSD